MSKKRKITDLNNTFQSIQNLVAVTKAKLEDEAARSAVIADLYKIAELATVARTHKASLEGDNEAQDDELDAQGVSLWNASGLVKQASGDDSLGLIAAMRLAAFRLVEAGMEPQPTPGTLRHILQLSSKTGLSFSELGNQEIANSVLTSAAEYEENLCNSDVSDPQTCAANASSVTVYRSARMQAAWKEGNFDVAKFMSRKILENHIFTSIPPRDRENVALIHLSIGRSLLKTEQNSCSRAQDAVYWLRASLQILEALEDSVIENMTNLKISALRALARAYFLSSDEEPGNLGKTEVALDELFALVDSEDSHSDDYQELRWQRLAVLKKQKADASAVLKAFQSLVDHMPFSESNITSILQELRLFNAHSLVSSVHQYCIERSSKSGSAHTDRLLLSLVMHCSRDSDHKNAMNEVKHALDYLYEASYRLPAVPAAACLTLLWKYGRANFVAKNWAQASDWYIVGTHHIFQDSSPTSVPKCFRKAALCHIEQGEFATASAVIRKCSSGEAATHYILLLISVKQGLEYEALKAVEAMVQAPDFDRKLLLAATKLSQESKMHSLLLSILEALYQTLKFNKREETVPDALTLIRCIIRLLLKHMDRLGTDRDGLKKALLRYFHAVQDLASAAFKQNAMATIVKDLNWFWRIAYNTAVVGCSEWEDGEDDVAELFNISTNLLDLISQGSPLDIDTNASFHYINASFSGISARVISCRKASSSTDTISVTPPNQLIDRIRACAKLVRSALEKGEYDHKAGAKERLGSFKHILAVFEAELLAKSRDWNGLLDLISKTTRADDSEPSVDISTFGAIADILWAEKDCPTNVLFAGLEAVLRASLDRQSLSVVKFSRWLRAMCTIVLAKGGSDSRTKAVGYIEQAITVIQDNCDGDDAYPMDERQWLLAATYNTGVECMHASLLDEGRRWLEAATVICRFVPNGKARKEKISEAYARLLSRHSQS